MSTLTLEEQAAPSTPSANQVVVYAKANGFMYSKDDTGLELPLNGVSSMTSWLSTNIALSTVAQYFDGPSIAQGTSGTWFVSGSITLRDTAGAASFNAKLWDGTTVMGSAQIASTGANNAASIALSGVLTSPVNDIRISVRDITGTTGQMLLNQTSTSTDCTITALRIG